MAGGGGGVSSVRALAIMGSGRGGTDREEGALAVGGAEACAGREGLVEGGMRGGASL
jgi:hypothetical protein